MSFGSGDILKLVRFTILDKFSLLDICVAKLPIHSVLNSFDKATLAAMAALLLFF